MKKASTISKLQAANPCVILTLCILHTAFRAKERLVNLAFPNDCKQKLREIGIRLSFFDGPSGETKVNGCICHAKDQ